MTKCAVCTRKNEGSKKKNNGFQLFPFPKEPAKKAKWTEIISNYIQEPDFAVNDQTRVCSDHFLPEDIQTTAKGLVRLSAEAVPIPVICPPVCPDPSQSSTVNTESQLKSNTEEENLLEQKLKIEANNMADESVELFQQSNEEVAKLFILEDLEEHIQMEEYEEKVKTNKDITECEFVSILNLENSIIEEEDVSKITEKPLEETDMKMEVESTLDYERSESCNLIKDEFVAGPERFHKPVFNMKENNGANDHHDECSNTDVPVKFSVNYIRKNNKTFQEKLILKSAGPPRPNLNIKKECKIRSKSFNRSFKREIYNKNKWLCGCECVNAFFCFPCLIFGGDSLWTDIGVTDLTHLGEKIKKHDILQVHLQNVMSLSVLGVIDIRNQLDPACRAHLEKYNEQVDKNRYILSRLIDCVKFCGAFKLALRGHDDSSETSIPVYRGLVDFTSELDTIMKEHLSSSTVFKGTSRSFQNDILDSILFVYHKHVCDTIRKCDYVAIEVDETTDVSTAGCVMILRYVEKGQVNERFWKYLTPNDDLAESILTELDQLRIAPQQLIAQCYDISGYSPTMHTKIKKEYPNAQFVHCYTHPLNLIIEKSVSGNKTIKKFFANLQAFTKFFSRSQKRVDVLKAIVSKKTSQKWNFNTRTVSSVYSYKEPLKDCMTNIIESENDAETIHEADVLLRYLNDETFMYWLGFFNSILPHSEKLFKHMQRKDIDEKSIKNNIEIFEKGIENVRDAIDKTEELIESSLLAKELCNIVISQVKDRFAYHSHMIAAKLFNSENFVTYRKMFPVDDYKTTVSTYPILHKLKLKNELSAIYNRDEFVYANRTLAILQLFYEADLTEAFSEITKLLNMLSTIPMSSVENDKCSTIKRVKTFLSNTMSQEKLDALSVLCIEKKYISIIPDFNNKVIEHFASGKNRRIDLIHKK